MTEGENAGHETRLLRIIDTIVACGDVSEADAKLIREAIEDGLRARDLLGGHGAWINIAIEAESGSDPRKPQIDQAKILLVPDPRTGVAGAFESASMKRWVNRWADLRLKEK